MSSDLGISSSWKYWIKPLQEVIPKWGLKEWNGFKRGEMWLIKSLSRGSRWAKGQAKGMKGPLGAWELAVDRNMYVREARKPSSKDHPKGRMQRTTAASWRSPTTYILSNSPNLGWANLFCKESEDKYFLDSVSPTVSVTTTQPCHFYRKGAIDNLEMNEGLCPNKTLYQIIFRRHNLSAFFLFFLAI